MWEHQGHKCNCTDAKLTLCSFYALLFGLRLIHRPSLYHTTVKSGGNTHTAIGKHLLYFFCFFFYPFLLLMDILICHLGRHRHLCKYNIILSLKPPGIIFLIIYALYVTIFEHSNLVFSFFLYNKGS